MIRVASLCVLAFAITQVGEAADLPVAPPPREIRPDGSRDAVPTPMAENPAEVVDRIIRNSKEVGDKLAKTDTGAETRGTQKSILKDIESLIDQQENPPPQGGDMNDKDKDKDKNQDKNMDQKNDMPKDGMDPKGGNQPKDGNQQANGRKPRQGSGSKGGQQPKPMPGGQQPEPGMAKANPMPMPMTGKENAGVAQAGTPMGKAATQPTLPIDDSVVKEVWGHLPDKLRQQVSQYYKEQFMPKYSDLLKQYYSSLANTQQKP